MVIIKHYVTFYSCLFHYFWARGNEKNGYIKFCLYLATLTDINCLHLSKAVSTKISIILASKYKENSIESTILKFQFHFLLFNFKANLNLIRNTYMELICKSQYQDAPIIHLMYSLSLKNISYLFIKLWRYFIKESYSILGL